MKFNLKTPTKIVKKRRQGFLVRMRTKHGRSTLSRRRAKGRHKIAI